MKLSNIEVLIMGNPPPSFGGRYFLFVKLTTESGIVGWGEAYASTIGPFAMKAVIEDVFARHFKGREAGQIEAAYRRVYSSGFTQRPDLTVMGAFSAIEIACWDIMGKALGQPIHALLGGALWDRLRAYTYLYPEAGEDAASFYNDPARSAERARQYVDAGYSAIKFDPAGPYTQMGGHQPALFDIERSVAFCQAIRGTIGNRADLLFGTHGQFTTSGAIRLAQAIAPYDPLWYEEPCPPDNLLEFATIARATSIPIATGERLCGKSEFATLLRTGGASILQPALGRVGGIWEAKKIAILAESFNAQIAPHLYAGPIEWAANLHLAASCPNFLMVETICEPDGAHQHILEGSIEMAGGYVLRPDAPGLGISINEDYIRAHPYEGTKLHLEMQEAPPHYDQPNRFAGG